MRCTDNFWTFPLTTAEWVTLTSAFLVLFLFGVLLGGLYVLAVRG
jgi:hypothetical protein